MLFAIVKSGVAIVLVFLVCVVIHEFGHYIVAKRNGVAVHSFAIGFGPKLLRWTNSGTEFSIRLFPFGGLVQLAGEIPQDAWFQKNEEIAIELNAKGQITKVGNPSDVKNGIVGVLHDLDLVNRMQMTLALDDGVHTFPVKTHANLMMNKRNSIPIVEKHEQLFVKSLWQRASIILAGPVMNFILAGVLFSVFFSHSGVTLNQPTLGHIITASPAAKAGLRQGDRVLSINGQKVTTWMDLVRDVEADKTLPPAPIQLKVSRGEQNYHFTVTPQHSSSGSYIGIYQPVSHNIFLVISHGVQSVYYGSIQIVQSLIQIVAHHQFQNLTGPVGIAHVISQEAQTGVWHVIMITAYLSLNLGLCNLIPIPALDGGKLFFMGIEALRGRAINPNKEGLVHFVGFALLMLFTVAITFRDVSRLF